MTDTRANLRRMMPDAFPLFFEGRRPYEGQAAVMPAIVRGHSVLFASPTASGKTEAAVTPLFQRHLSLKRRSISTVYVAPTKALVNDLHQRLVAVLGTRFPSAVARYTGDRHELGSTSSGFCVLTTPESLDSLQLRRPGILADVRAVVVDEIHLLHGQPRGQQLRHVIDRIRLASSTPTSSRDCFQTVGMTATLDDMESVRSVWLDDTAKLVVHSSPRKIESHFLNLPSRSTQDPYKERAKALARWLDAADVKKVLAFANSRNSAHSMAAHLHRELSGKRWPVHLHFGALAQSHRERVEDDMRKSQYGVCVATSTLEIGIDIGDIDVIVLVDLPSTVSAFLQRIGRGNRRSGVSRVIGFRGSGDEERLFRALLDCGSRGELDGTFEYDRPSVRFQQIASLCWRATRKEFGLTLSGLAKEAGTTKHEPVVNDMIDMGCLSNSQGVLIPSDRLMDEADAGRIHSVIAGQPSNPVLDSKTGDPVMRDAADPSWGGAVFVGGTMRRLIQGVDGTSFLGDVVSWSQPLARIRAAGPAIPLSRSVVWGLARQLGHDPMVWRLIGQELTTWGGAHLNFLIAAYLAQCASGASFTPSAIGVSGPVSLVGEISVEAIRDWASQAQQDDSLPLEVAGRFTNPSRFLNQLSNSLGAEERRNSVPWSALLYWLSRVQRIERIVGDQETNGGSPPL